MSIYESMSVHEAKTEQYLATHIREPIREISAAQIASKTFKIEDLEKMKMVPIPSSSINIPYVSKSMLILSLMNAPCDQYTEKEIMHTIMILTLEGLGQLTHGDETEYIDRISRIDSALGIEATEFDNRLVAELARRLAKTSLHTDDKNRRIDGSDQTILIKQLSEMNLVKTDMLGIFQAWADKDSSIVREHGVYAGLVQMTALVRNPSSLFKNMKSRDANKITSLGSMTDETFVKLIAGSVEFIPRFAIIATALQRVMVERPDLGPTLVRWCLLKAMYARAPLPNLFFKTSSKFGVNFKILFKKTANDHTAPSWKLLNDYLWDMEIGKNAPEYSKEGLFSQLVPFARIIDQSYYTSMSGQKAPVLCALLLIIHSKAESADEFKDVKAIPSEPIRIYWSAGVSIREQFYRVSAVDEFQNPNFAGIAAGAARPSKFSSLPITDRKEYNGPRLPNETDADAKARMQRIGLDHANAMDAYKQRVAALSVPIPVPDSAAANIFRAAASAEQAGTPLILAPQATNPPPAQTNPPSAVTKSLPRTGPVNI